MMALCNLTPRQAWRLRADEAMRYLEARMPIQYENEQPRTRTRGSGGGGDSDSRAGGTVTRHIRTMDGLVEFLRAGKH